MHICISLVHAFACKPFTPPTLVLPVYLLSDWSHPRCTASCLLVCIMLCGICLGPCLPALPCLSPSCLVRPPRPSVGREASCRAVHACCGMCAALLRACGASCVWGVAPSPALETHHHQASTQASFSWVGVVLCTYILGFSATAVVAAATHCQVTLVTPGEAGWCARTSRRRTVWVLLHRGQSPAHCVSDGRGQIVAKP